MTQPDLTGLASHLTRPSINTFIQHGRLGSEISASKH
ncbi:hypothetical protein PIIN_11156 [Serendipita indica DSM 11827]|uniref:Uncharacterized protein n=1 Tax=Serendipita indica (strain DSM 11827) TaxID=1109443 RepID=G4U0T1_SERID|nr:hypothetical protein PIIN_11156 [Serendipita indica DSM 11827]